MSPETQKLMKVLGISEQEALELQEFDKAVDRMKDKEVVSDLTQAQKEVSKQARQADRKKPFIPDLKKRERKPNETKALIISTLEAFLSEMTDFPIKNLKIANKERQIDFEVDGNSFSLTLTQHRAAKK